MSLRKLLLPVVAAALLHLPVSAQKENASEAQDARPTDLLVTVGRMQVVPPGQPLKLGQPAAIQLRLTGPKLLKLFSLQGLVEQNGVPAPPVKGGEQELTPEQHRDGSTWVMVVPQALGKLQIVLMGFFADGGPDQTVVTVDVIPATAPTSLHMGGGGLMLQGVLFMDLGWEWGKARLWTSATYPGVQEPLYVAGKEVRYRVITNRGASPIRFDPATATVEAQRLGHALIEASYGGLSQSLCVVVSEGDRRPHEDCTELRPGGNRILPTAPGADAPGAAQGSTLPYTGCQMYTERPILHCDWRDGRFLAEDRVEIVPPAHPLAVAEENAVAVRIRGGTLAQIRCDNGGCTRPSQVLSSVPTIPWQQESAGRVRFRVFPTELGKQTHDLTFLFADGGVAHRTFDAQVGLGARKPLAINTSCGNDSYPNPNLPAYFAMPRPGKEHPPKTLSMDACYDGVRSFVMLPPQVIQYRVLSDSEAPVVRVDEKTGQVTPLREGQALLERSYAGLSTVTCIVVVPAEGRDAPDLSNCRALRAQYGFALPPLRYHAKPDVIADTEKAARFQSLNTTTYWLGNRVYQMSPMQIAILSPEAKDRFEANDRLEIPGGFVAPLGQESRLPIRLYGPEPLELVLTQRVRRRVLLDHPPRIQEITVEKNYGATHIIRAADGSLGINVYPQQTGTAVFRLGLVFADGGVAAKTVEVPVQAPANANPALINGAEDDGPEMPPTPVRVLHLVPGAGMIRAMFPFVSFNPQQMPVALPPNEVTFSVDQPRDPVIRLDPATGIVTALRVGHALIRTRFDGAELETCAVVMANLTEGDSSNCEELRRK